MTRIGLVDLDTSHPAAFTRILRAMPGVEVTALWDGHEVWPKGYETDFAREHHIPVVCSALEEMLDHVDAVMIHGVNWDTHIDKALVFMKAGKPVLIDKPVVGSVRDARRLLDLQAVYGTIVYGGSSLRFAEEITAIREETGGREHLASVVASGPGDFFSYGIHTTEMLQGGIGIGVRSVRVIRSDRPVVLALTYHDGFTALVQLQMPFYAWTLSAYTDRGLRVATVNPDRLYEPFLKNFVSLLRNEGSAYMLTAPLEAVLVHIAARVACERGTEVVLDDLPGDAGFDGRAFAAEYAALKQQSTRAGVQR